MYWRRDSRAFRSPGATRRSVLRLKPECCQLLSSATRSGVIASRLSIIFRVRSQKSFSSGAKSRSSGAA